MKLKLTDWASVAEILGAFAIVVSLLFVGFQINDSNRETRAATAQSALDLEMLFETQIAQFAGTWDKVITGMPLADGEESRRGIVLFNMMMTLNENRFVQMKSGFLEVQPDALAEGVNWPIYQTWQQSGGYRSRSREFRDFLESYRQQIAGE